MVYLFINFLIILLDQISKKIVKAKLEAEAKIEIAKNKFYIWHRKNTGASFSLFSGHAREIALITSVFTAAGYFLFAASVFGRKNRALKTGLALFLGGAAGNLLDRIRDKEVTDFLFLKFRHAPIFNFADICLLAGTITSVFGLFREK